MRSTFTRPLVALLAMGLAMPGCSSKTSAPEPLTLLVVTGLMGTTEPCGCTSDPLGGLDRLVTKVEELRRKGPTELIIVGSTFFELPDPPPHRWEQERAKAEVIAKVLARLRPAVILPGPFDTGVQLEVLQRLASTYNLPVVSPPRGMATRERADSTLLDIAGLKVGVVGMAAPHKPEISGYVMAARMMRKQGADVVVGLIPLEHKVAVEFAAASEGMSVLVSAGGDELVQPTMGDQTLVVEANNKGQYLGVLELHPKFTADATPEARREWVFFDGGKSHRDSLEARIKQLEEALARIPEGEARTARQQKLTELQQELQSVKSDPPPISYITWRAEKVSKKETQPTAWATELLAGYNRSLCDISKAATADLACPPAPTPADAYAGTAACAGCHPDDVAVYERTKHAHAWATLTQAGKECDVGCIGCHTVGYEQAGGYCRLVDAEANKNVGCESCHGPSAGHAAAPQDRTKWGVGFRPKPGQEVCAGCHNHEHSDLFDFATYLPQVLGPGHGQPLPGAQPTAATEPESDPK